MRFVYRIVFCKKTLSHTQTRRQAAFKLAIAPIILKLYAYMWLDFKHLTSELLLNFEPSHIFGTKSRSFQNWGCFGAQIFEPYA